MSLPERERCLVDVARELARFLNYQIHGQHARITLGRRLHDTLMMYEDIEPCHDTDRAAWRTRQGATG